MKFYTYGDKHNPIMIMLTGSFCPAKALDYLYDELKNDFYIIVPEYNGHHENSTFTTRKNEAKSIADYLEQQNLNTVKMIYGQSMGSEIGIELLYQLINKGVQVDSTFFDGAPCIKLSKAYKAFMYFKFRTMINMMRNKTIDEVISWKFLNKFTNGDTESLRPMISSLIDIAPFMTDESIKNENECCYTFDFPNIPQDVQKHMHFFYAKEEKAYKTCIKYVKKAYPDAKYKVISGYGHMTYSVKNTEKYIEVLRRICGVKRVEKDVD